jgi:hypothetical protein
VSTLSYHPLLTLGPLIFPRTWKPPLPNGSKEFNVFKNHQIVKFVVKKYQMKVFICHYNTWMGKINKKTKPTRVVSHYGLAIYIKGYV